MADWQGEYRFTETSNGDSTKSQFSDKLENLQKREDERQEKLRKKKEEDDSFKVQENIQSFLDNFNCEKKVIENHLEESFSVDKKHLIVHFDALSQSVIKLERYVSESAMFLPPYELKTAQNMLVALKNKIQEKRDEMLPKKKFAFRSNRKTEKKSNISITTKCDKDIQESKSEDDLIIELAACKFVGVSNQTLTKDAEEINLKDVALADLTECTVLLKGAPSAIHINKLKNCKIFCGPVPGSIFIRECIDCIFVLACQQLRIHSSTQSQFYIHVTSKAIIEDCNTVRFARYNWTYNDLEKHYEKSGLSKERNNWDKVDDFNWLAADVHSPNWAILEESESVVTWNV